MVIIIFLQPKDPFDVTCIERLWKAAAEQLATETERVVSVVNGY